MRKLRIDELKRKGIEEFKKTRKNPVVVVLDNIRSQNNIGSIFRTADAFLVEKVYLCGITATPPNKEIHKTALGATDSVDWEYFNETRDVIMKLKDAGYEVIAVEQTENNTQLQDYKIDKERSYALVFGHEIKGIDQDVINLCHAAIEIPQLGTKHSLNISVCAGIVLWDFFKIISGQS